MNHRHATTITPNYHAFLLRLWREDSTAAWRCSLQAADTVERLGFVDLRQLATYLLGLTDETGTQPSQPRDMTWPAHAQHNTPRDNTIVPQTGEE